MACTWRYSYPEEFETYTIWDNVEFTAGCGTREMPLTAHTEGPVLPKAAKYCWFCGDTIEIERPIDSEYE